MLDAYVISNLQQSHRIANTCDVTKILQKRLRTECKVRSQEHVTLQRL